MTTIPLMREEDLEMGRGGGGVPPTYKEATETRKYSTAKSRRLGGFINDRPVATHLSVAAAEVSIRMAFLRKVLGIVATQLLFTTIFGAFLILLNGAKGFVQQQTWMLYLGFFGSIALILLMTVYRHEFPHNYIFLAAFTLCQSYTVGVFVTFFDVDLVLVAFFLTFVVVAGLFVYSFQTKRDFTSAGPYLFAGLTVLLVAGLVQMLIMSPMFDFLISTGGALLFSLYIVFDLQMIMYEMSPEDYILGAITLYLDIINLFMHILKILAQSRRE